VSLLELDHVAVRYGAGRHALTAVDDVSLAVEAGTSIGIVGESGSGKSTLARAIVQLVPTASGRITLDGRDVTGARGSAVRHIRDRVQMVFQDPFASLNPYHTVRHHLERPIRLHHRGMSAAEVGGRVLELLERVRLTPAEHVAERRPHELSGGQRQRVAIARALAPEPGILVADEPVSMLDVSIRLGVLNLLATLQREEDLGVLYITHDLATARHFADDILVLYRGRVVERGPADEVIRDPRHPYTKLLAAASPDPAARGRSVTIDPAEIVEAGSAPAYEH
jgi:peptide/nickel transport system ATP-binding protein